MTLTVNHAASNPDPSPNPNPNPNPNPSPNPNPNLNPNPNPNQVNHAAEAQPDVGRHVETTPDVAGQPLPARPFGRGWPKVGAAPGILWRW